MPTGVAGYDVQGPADGTPLTFSHSLGADRQLWQPQVDFFARSYRVITYDIRGHGHAAPPTSDVDINQLAQDVLDLWNNLGITRSHFVGLSLGGCIGTALALRAPQRLHSLVVANARLQMDEAATAMWRQRAEAVRHGGMATIAEATLERWLTPGFARAHPLQVENVRRTLLATAPAGFAACAQALSTVSLQDRLAAIETPTLFLAGLDDVAVPAALTEAYASANPRFSYQAMPGPHLLSLENAAVFNAAVAAFLQAQQPLKESPA